MLLKPCHLDLEHPVYSVDFFIDIFIIPDNIENIPVFLNIYLKLDIVRHNDNGQQTFSTYFQCKKWVLFHILLK